MSLSTGAVSSGKWRLFGAIRKKKERQKTIKTFFTAKNFFIPITISYILEFLYISRTNLENKSIQIFFIRHKKKITPKIPKGNSMYLFLNCRKIERIFSSG